MPRSNRGRPGRFAPPASGGARGLYTRERLDSGHLPCESREPRIVAIECDPLATPFDGERCEPGIANTGSAGFRLDAKSLEDIPVPLSRLAMGLSEQIFAKCERASSIVLGDVPRRCPLRFCNSHPR